MIWEKLIFVVIVTRKWRDFLLIMTAILGSLMTQLIAMISVAARPPLVLAKISAKPVIHRCLIWHSKNRHKQRWEKGIQLLGRSVAPGRWRFKYPTGDLLGNRSMQHRCCMVGTVQWLSYWIFPLGISISLTKKRKIRLGLILRGWFSLIFTLLGVLLLYNGHQGIRKKLCITFSVACWDW